MSDGETLPGAEELAARARAILTAHWQPEGYTVPNAATYPFAWLWDSCFHALIWAELGDERRALTELAHVFRCQDEATGFVPHVDYQRDPDVLRSFWGRSDASTITQPPMYGHAARVGHGVDSAISVETAAMAMLIHVIEKKRSRLPCSIAFQLA